MNSTIVAGVCHRRARRSSANALISLAMLVALSFAGCASKHHGLWSVAPIPAGFVHDLAEMPVVFAGSRISKGGRLSGGSAVRCAGVGMLGVSAPGDSARDYYLTASHVLPHGAAMHSVNLDSPTILHRDEATFVRGLRDGWCVVSTRSMTITGDAPPKLLALAPTLPLNIDQPVYIVATWHAGNDQIRAASQLPAPENIIVSARVSRALEHPSGAFVALKVDPTYSFEGLSGAACVVWDADARDLRIVGVLLATLATREAVMVRPVPLNQPGTTRLEVLPPRHDPIEALFREPQRQQ